MTQLTAERTLVTLTNAQLSTCLCRLNRCRSLGVVGLCSGDICPPNPPFHTDCRACVHVVWFFSIFVFSKCISLTTLTSPYWLKLPVFSYSYSICCPHMQLPYLHIRFQFPCLVYMTRLGHRSVRNRGWLIACLQRWIWLPVSLCAYVFVSL